MVLSLKNTSLCLAPLPITIQLRSCISISSIFNDTNSDKRTPLLNRNSTIALKRRVSQAILNFSISVILNGFLISFGTLMFPILLTGFLIIYSSFSSHWKKLLRFLLRLFTLFAFIVL